jgi:RNA polymerase sigma-70 factor (ECF subfamily)
LAETLGNQDDLALMNGIANGDREALSRLYDRYNRLVFTLCLRVVKDRGEAEDLLIEVFQEVWERSGRYDASRGSPLTYLSTLTRSRAIDRLRSRGRAVRQTSTLANVSDPPANSNDANPGNVAVLTEQRSRVSAALAKLEPPYREMVELSFYDGLSHSEIASKMNRPLGTVKTYIRQGLIRLRDALRTE